MRGATLPRPQPPIGTLGEISTTEPGKRRVGARARYRDLAGQARQIEATITSATAARRALEQTLATGMAATGDLVVPSMRVAALREVWLTKISQSSRSPQTVAQYRRILETLIMPGVGGQTRWEATTGQLDRIPQGRGCTDSRAGEDSQGGAVSDLRGTAAQHDVVRAIPVPDTRLPDRRPKAVRVLTVEELHALRRGLRAYLNEPTKRGSGRPQDLAKEVNVALGRGCV